MSNALKMIILAAGTIITLLTITLGFYIGREGQGLAYGATGKISQINKEFSESDKTMYDGLSVSGSEVLSAVNRFKTDDISIKVTTKKSVTYYNRVLTNSDTELGTTSSAAIKDAQDILSLYYINQRATFTGEVKRDANGTPIGISFVQN